MHLAISVPYLIISGGAGVGRHTKEELSDISPNAGELRGTRGSLAQLGPSYPFREDAFRSRRAEVLFQLGQLPWASFTLPSLQFLQQTVMMVFTWLSPQGLMSWRPQRAQHKGTCPVRPHYSVGCGHTWAVLVCGRH